MNTDIIIRDLEQEDAFELSALFRRCYGETYGSSVFYDPAALVELINKQELISAVATKGQHLIGHIGITPRHPGSIVCETGNTVVDPNARGQGVLLRLGVALHELAKRMGYVAYLHYPTTAHETMQRASVAYGGKETGVMLAYVPEATDAKVGGRQAGRIAATVAYQPLTAPPVRNVILPQRYHDVISSFGGKTSYDADNRPLLVMRSNLWASGYDVDGTDQTSLGQFSGRVQQTYKHSVPRFFVPEHGTMFTLALVRFPPTATKEIQYLNAKGALTYTDIAGDPVLYGNLPPREISMKDVFRSGDSSKKFKIAEGQWYRYAPSYVSPAYHLLEGFPFIQEPPSGDLQERVLIRHHDYDQCFQSVQLLQWNSQVKFNVTVYRNLPTTRDSIMTS